MLLQSVLSYLDRHICLLAPCHGCPSRRPLATNTFGCPRMILWLRVRMQDDVHLKARNNSTGIATYKSSWICRHRWAIDGTHCIIGIPLNYDGVPGPRLLNSNAIKYWIEKTIVMYDASSASIRLIVRNTISLMHQGTKHTPPQKEKWFLTRATQGAFEENSMRIGSVYNKTCASL